MSNVKSKLLEQINKKADKIKSKKIEAANNKTLENYVFDFFRHAEESRLIHQGKQYDSTLVSEAKKSLEDKIRTIDYKAKISIEFESSDVNRTWQEMPIRGVTIWWSRHYIATHNVHPSLYIDISQMLFM